MVFGQFVEYRGYIGSIEYSQEDGIYFGSLLDIRDSISYDGYTIEELYQSYHDAVDYYIEINEALKKTVIF